MRLTDSPSVDVAQLYGVNENATAILFGDRSSGKFGTYFVRDGKVRTCPHRPPAA